MASLIARFNKEFEALTRNNLEPAPNVREIEEDRYKFYVDRQAKDKPFEVMFDYASNKGDLSCVVNGITLLMTAERFKTENPYYSKKIKDRFLANYIQVRVHSIDRDNNIVELVPFVNKGDVKYGVIRELGRAVDNGEHPTVWGVVTMVSKKRVVVNIFKRNILGIVEVADWSYAYTRDLMKAVEKGELLSLVLKGRAEKRKDKETGFLLSRKELLPDPWKSIKDVEVNGVINVKVIDRPEGKPFAWGVNPRFPDVEIMVNLRNTMEIMEGLSYKCKVVDFQPDKKIFKCSPFELVVDKKTKKALEYLSQKSDT